MSAAIGPRRWLLTALACAALLIVPLLGLLLMPAPARPGPPPARPSAALAPTESAGAVQPASEELGVVTGVVLDDWGAPVAGARVRLAGGHVPEVLSDAEGRYRLSGIPENAAALTAIKEGYADAHVRLPRPASPSEERHLDVHLERAGPVRGRVLDADGKPAPRAFVTCDDKPGIAGSTDDEGRFELPPEAAGCSATATHATLGPSESVRLRTDRDNTLELGRGGAIAGNVYDERGAAVSSYLLAIESFMPAGAADTPSPAGKAHKVDDASGAFLWEGLVAGRYVLTASADGRPPARSDSVTVEAGRTTSRVRITLARGATLAGTVTDADSRAPVADARVGLDAQTSTGANSIAAVTTDASGAFSLVGVPPGPFSIRIEHPAYRTKIVPGLVTRGAPVMHERFAVTARGDGGGGDSELAGIGAVLAQGPKGTLIAGVIDGGPAAQAGVRKGDRIERIDGGVADGLTVSDCVQRLRGAEGSRVTLTVGREGGATTDITITRAVIIR